jgi:hypothetical protein
VTPYFEWEPVPGASFYQIQIDTSDSFGSLLYNQTIDVPHFTPWDALQNDTDLFWRVRAFHRPNSGNTAAGYGGPWSEVREFQLAWSSRIGAGEDYRPLQLTPPNNATYVNRPLFCWQPVAGAKEYEIDIAKNPAFIAGSFIIENKITRNTCYNFDRNSGFDLDPSTLYYWRVTARDAKGFFGQSTDIGSGSAAFQFQTAPTEVPYVPSLFYPPYYYEPILSGNFEDRTVAVPTFMWDHVEGATAYELRIDDDAAMQDPPTVEVTTANASFTFTDTASYPLQDGEVYYWKVRALGTPQGTTDWDQMGNKWKARIDRSRAVVTDTIQLIQPTYQSEPWTDGYRYGQESVTYYPSFSWTAVAPIGDATYEIQIAEDEGFNHLVHTAQTEFAEYTPTGRPEPGTYFWRVRQSAPTSGVPSQPGRFIVSRNFTVGLITVDGDPADWTLVPDAWYAPSGENLDAGAPHNLSGFYIANDNVNWYLGLNLSPMVDLGIYFDIDHFDQSGADGPPAAEGQDPGAPEAHQPEYAIYWSTDNTSGAVYEWDGSAWQSNGTLSTILAAAAYSETLDFLELGIPVTQLGQPGSLSVMLYTMDSQGQVQDLVPNRSGSGQEMVPAFLTESTTPTPLLPANAPSDPALATIERNTPVLIWRHNEINPAFGSSFFFQTYEDNTLTNLYEGEQGNSPSNPEHWFYNYNPYWAPMVHYSDNNSYHWLIQRGGFSASAANHFRKAGFIPLNLQFSPLIVSGTMTYTNRTPDFTWQATQSAPQYLWELWRGGQRVRAQETMMPFYTPRDAIADGTYTWKVYAKDPQGRLTAEAGQGEFRKVSDTVPVGTPEYSTRTLVLHWNPVDYAAYYRVEIADDPQFSRDKVAYDTYNTTFSPPQIPNAVKDGAFFWRVFLYDNRNNPGPAIDLRFDLYPEKVYLPVLASD